MVDLVSSTEFLGIDFYGGVLLSRTVVVPLTKHAAISLCHIVDKISLREHDGLGLNTIHMFNGNPLTPPANILLSNKHSSNIAWVAG